MAQRDTETEHISRAQTNYGEIVLDHEGGQYWHLNDTASMVMSVLSDGGTVEDAVVKLIGEYEVSREQAQADVELISEQLRELRIL